MLKISNPRKYGDMIAFTFLAALAVLCMIFLWKGGRVGGYLITFGIFATAMLAKPFTKSLTVDSNNLRVEYFKMGFQRVHYFETNKTTIKIGKAVANRAGTVYTKINLLVNDKIVYTVNSYDGFDNDELIDFAKRINIMNASSVREK